jgi:transposase InsO family protein
LKKQKLLKQGDHIFMSRKPKYSVEEKEKVVKKYLNGKQGLWGTLKTEKYYLHKYKNYRSLKSVIEKYIKYYNTKRYQKRLKRMSPLEFHNYLLSVA